MHNLSELSLSLPYSFFVRFLDAFFFCLPIVSSLQHAGQSVAKSSTNILAPIPVDKVLYFWIKCHFFRSLFFALNIIIYSDILIAILAAGVFSTYENDQAFFPAVPEHLDVFLSPTSLRFVPVEFDSGEQWRKVEKSGEKLGEKWRKGVKKVEKNLEKSGEKWRKLFSTWKKVEKSFSPLGEK